MLLITPAHGSEEVLALINQIRPTAQSLTIDGEANDWTGIPSFSDAVGDTSDPTRDIVAAAIAPLDDSWIVRIETKGLPSTDDLAFWLIIDYRGQEVVDLELGLYLSFPDVLFWTPDDSSCQPPAPSCSSNWDQTHTAIGSVIEAKIPLLELETELRTRGQAAMADELSGTAARPWIRITPYSYDVSTQQRIDTGPAVASYRLIETPFPLDPAVLEPNPGSNPDPAIDLKKPLAGIQYVGQGAGGRFSHAELWAYDLLRVDSSLHPDQPHPASNNRSYFSFGDEIRAPSFATVLSLANGNPDAPPRASPCSSGDPNFVFLDVGSQAGVLLSHLQQDSVEVSPSDSVALDEPLGLVGHSGSCTWPHLHLEARTLGNGDPSRPVRFTNVEVGLNPVLDDPWLRQIPGWDLREGYLIRTYRCEPTALTLDQSSIGTAEHFFTQGTVRATDFRVRDGDSVRFSGHEIELESGFAVAAGGEFRAAANARSCP